MRVITRKPGEAITIGDHTVVKVLWIERGQAVLGIQAPLDVLVADTQLPLPAARAHGRRRLGTTAGRRVTVGWGLARGFLRRAGEVARWSGLWLRAVTRRGRGLGPPADTRTEAPVSG